MQLPINNQQTAIYNNLSIYVQYKKWLFQNGVLVDTRIRYPTYFGQKSKGVVGVSAIKPIQKGKVVIAVPYNLLITMQKVMNVQVLSQIVHSNPDVFGVSDNCIMKIIVLYLCYQLIKQKASFYYPYFQISKDSYLQKWSKMELIALDDIQLMKVIKQQKQIMDTFFLQFLRLFTKYDNIFPSTKGNMFYQQLFERAFSFVSTRAFGWSLPSISLIPMADSLNHGNNYLNHYLVDTEQQKKPSQKYVCHKQKSNLSLLKQQTINPSQQVLAKLRKKRLHRYQKFVQKHKEILTSSKQINQLESNSKIDKLSSRNKQYFILCEQYKSEVHNLRQLHFYPSSCSEDNDTDQQQLTSFVMKRQKFQFDEKYQVKKNTNISSKSIKQSPIKLNKQSSTKNIKQQSSNKNKTQEYWKLWIDNRIDDDQTDSDQQEKQEISTKKQQSQKQTKISQKQTLQKFQQKKHESSGSSSVSSTQSEQDDEQFQWMKTHLNQQYKNSYFVMQTRNIIRQNQQCHNFYGRRSNRFLLHSYNFTMINNQYDSYEFRLFIDPTLTIKPNIDKLVYKGKRSSNKKLSREIRLKSQRISLELVNHCRCYVIQFQKKDLLPQNPTITIPFDIQIQIKMFKLYKQVLQRLKKQQQIQHQLQQDHQLLQKAIHYEVRTAIKYRIMQKTILIKQYQFVQLAQEYLTKRWKNNRIIKPTWKDIRDIHPIRHYLHQLQRANIL